MILLCAALLPLLYWDQPPSSAPQLRAAGIERIAVAPSSVDAWRATDIKAEPFEPAKAVKLPVPHLEMRRFEAAATSQPWIDENGWRMLRDRDGRFYYDVPARSTALAAAEAYVFQGNAFVHTDQDGLAPFSRMVAFVRAIPEASRDPLYNFDLVDDHSAEMGEVINLLIRRNLLFRLVDKPDAAAANTITHSKIGSVDPARAANMIRQEIGDDRRLIRIYGTEVVIARLEGNRDHARLHLLNYAARPVIGMRVRVLGPYRHAAAHIFGVNDAAVSDIATDAKAIEFTVPSMNEYAVIDVSK